MRNLVWLLTAAALLAQAPGLTVGGDYPKQFERWLTQQAETHWDQRERTVAALSSAAQIKARQEYVRRTARELIGGLPAGKTPLNARVTSKAPLEGEGYRIENIIFESLPGFQVTANLYLPARGRKPFPAVLGVAGHSVNGKASSTYQTAFIGFAQRGIAVLAYDPPGQGERLEFLDPVSGKSRAGIGVPEHQMAGLQCLLTGTSMARYEIHDGIRAFDYLLTRPEIDPKRIAVAGNSGGGTQAAYLAVMEPRLAGVVSSCYMTRWRELWSGPGPQDAEQVWPEFIARGLDFGDFALAAAPRPFLMTTAIRDYFPIDGARTTFKQTQRLFDLLTGGEKMGYFEFDDTHGWSKPRRQAANRWLEKWLLGKDSDGAEGEILTEEETKLYATSTGQVSTSGGTETVQSLNRKLAAELKTTREKRAEPVTVARIKQVIGYREPAAGSPPASVRGKVAQDGYQVEKLELAVEGGVSIPALLYYQTLAEPPTRAWIFASGAGTAGDPDIAELVRAGHVVLAVDPRGSGEGYRARGVGDYSGPYQLAARTWLLGRNLVEMQAADLVMANRYLRSRIGDRRVGLLAKGTLGPAAIFAAALDSGFGQLVLERSVLSYSAIVDAAVHSHQDNAVVPGILKHFDLPDVLRTLVPRRVTLVSPVTPNQLSPGLIGAVTEVATGPARSSVVVRGEAWTLRRTVPEMF
ncbi:MAG: alpha/beta fold hydrolase [Acidobacteria bacterium]|nr:alpha/beta fold hydrolase [Acidobacteriota bacterium]